MFIDSLDALHVLGNDVRASTAAHNSARFMYISPAGDLGSAHGSVIDGGYFENFGALSALEIARTAMLELKGKEPPVKLVVLMISSDPDLAQSHALVRIKKAKVSGDCLVSVAERENTVTSDAGGSQKSAYPPNYLSINKEQVQNTWVNEFLAPIKGIQHVREAHGNRAAAELALYICSEYSKPAVSTNASPPALQLPAPASEHTEIAAVTDKGKGENVNGSSSAKASHEKPYFAHLAMCKVGNLAPPLGWVLSEATRKSFDSLLGQCGNANELTELETALGLSQQATSP